MVPRTVRPPPEQRVDPRAVTLWRVEALLRSGALLLLLLATLASLATVVPLGLWVVVAVLVLFVVYSAVQIVVVPRVRYHYWRYQVDEHELDIQQGVFVVRRTVIPLVRVQHVDTVQGPLSKQFGLSSVTVATAAGGHLIPALTDSAAEALRDRISALARVARESL